MDLCVLQLHGPDLVLGMDWLKSLGRVTSDYEEGTLEFASEGRQIRLQLTSRLHRQVSARVFSSLMLHIDHATIYEVMAVPEADTFTEAATTGEQPSFPEMLPPTVRAVLEQYTSVFTVPSGLSPAKQFDHRIHLLPHMKPVNVRPYRYSFFQKNEIKRQVKEMLDTSIIRRGSSAFSSSVLLIRKKDGSFRFCIDFCTLNAVTVPDHFPIPTTDELLMN